MRATPDSSRIRVAVALVALALVALPLRSTKATPPAPSARTDAVADGCHECHASRGGPTIANDAALELSGIVASALHEGVFYVHNDSGDSARFFAVAGDGRDLGTYVVDGAVATDWEDVARGPCGARGGSCLFFADVGDNLASRRAYAIVRAREPAELSPGTHTVQADVLRFRYPDGSHDAETVLVDPSNGALLVVTKASAGPSTIYEIPFATRPGGEVEAIARGVVATAGGAPIFTGGSVHPRGEGILLRAYGSLFFYPRAASGRVEDTLARRPCPMSVAFELQGEAVAWLASGDGYVTVAEGRAPALHFSRCSASSRAGSPPR